MNIDDLKCCGNCINCDDDLQFIIDDDDFIYTSRCKLHQHRNIYGRRYCKDWSWDEFNQSERNDL